MLQALGDGFSHQCAHWFGMTGGRGKAMLHAGNRKNPGGFGLPGEGVRTMKAIDIIERVDLLEPNDYSPEQKLHWLSSLDGKIFHEMIRTHEKAQTEEAPVYQTGDEELLVGAPYGEDLYYYYLQAMIAAENSETQRYNRRMTLFNSAYTGWANFYQRTHRPLRAGTHFVF